MQDSDSAKEPRRLYNFFPNNFFNKFGHVDYIYFFCFQRRRKLVLKLEKYYLYLLITDSFSYVTAAKIYNFLYLSIFKPSNIKNLWYSFKKSNVTDLTRI